MSGLLTGTWARPATPSPIPLSLMVVVQNAISVAWHRLLEAVNKRCFSICEAQEDEITEELHMILGELQASDEVPGFSSFSMAREAKLRNHDGKKLDGQPDLVFYPLRGAIRAINSVLAGIFVECKPIDGKHPVPSIYCKEGLIRFVRGDYAWAVDRALMVGYVRNHCSLPHGLAPCIEKDRVERKYRFHGGLVAAGATILGDTVYLSIHGRDSLSSSPSAAVHPITLHHLWLYPATPCETSRCRSGPSNVSDRASAQGIT